jgi:hypothetical protein
MIHASCRLLSYSTHPPATPPTRSVGELRRAGVTEAPAALFSLGQVVKVRVVSCDAAKRRIVVCEASSAQHTDSSSSSSKKLDATALAAVAASAASAIGANATSATLVGVEGAGADAVLSVRLVDGTAAQLPAAHLTDHAALVVPVLEAMRARVGRTLFDEAAASSASSSSASAPRAVVWAHLRGVPQLTCKPLLVAALVAAAGNDDDEDDDDMDGGSASAGGAMPRMPRSAARVRVGQLLIGSVRRIEAFGLFVAFAGAPAPLVALAPKSQLADQARAWSEAGPIMATRQWRIFFQSSFILTRIEQ